MQRIQKKLQELSASDEVKEKISKEIERFKTTNNNVSENSVLRGYIETLLSLPWDNRSEDSEDLKEAWENTGERALWFKGCKGTYYGVPFCP